MDKVQVVEAVETALRRTPGGAAEISLILKEPPHTWIVLLQDGDEELAIRVEEEEEETLEAFEKKVAASIRSLF